MAKSYMLQKTATESNRKPRTTYLQSSATTLQSQNLLDVIDLVGIFVRHFAITSHFGLLSLIQHLVAKALEVLPDTANQP
jgi:hypothetical protein